MQVGYQLKHCSKILLETTKDHTQLCTQAMAFLYKSFCCSRMIPEKQYLKGQALGTSEENKSNPSYPIHYGVRKDP